MQFLKISNSTKLAELSDNVGSKNLDRILNVNGLVRTPNIGKQFAAKCESVIQDNPQVEIQRKISLLNQFTQDDDIFESASLLDENGWKLLSNIGTMPNYLAIPESARIPDSVDVLGSGITVASNIYNKAMQSLQTTGTVNPAIFDTYSTIKSAKVAPGSDSGTQGTLDAIFKIPWGKISLYSTLSDNMVDIPAYPENLSDGAKANYTTMPDLLYQYEPWQLYQSSGPRIVTYTFTLHRDMWQSDHNQGGAAKLIDFCEANCYPTYDGSAVYSSTVTLYMNGKPHITGVLTDVGVEWSGPLGHDGYHLVFKLSLTIAEVSANALSFNSVLTRSLLG